MTINGEYGVHFVRAAEYVNGTTTDKDSTALRKSANSTTSVTSVASDDSDSGVSFNTPIGTPASTDTTPMSTDSSKTQAPEISVNDTVSTNGHVEVIKIVNDNTNGHIEVVEPVESINDAEIAKPVNGNTNDHIQLAKSVNGTKSLVNSQAQVARGGKGDESLTVVDNRSGKAYYLPIENNSINGKDLNAIKVQVEDQDVPNPGLYIYDPGFRYTAPLKSDITRIDGVTGTISFRGHSVFDLVETKEYEDVAYLLIWGHLPTFDELLKFRRSLAAVELPQNALDAIHSFPRESPPMMMLYAGLAAVAASQPSKIPAVAGQNLYVGNMPLVDREIIRSLSSLAQVSAAAFCHRMGRPFTRPDPQGSYIHNLLLMMGIVDEQTGKPYDKHVDALGQLFLLMADHEMTNSTAAFLHCMSSLNDPISGMIACATSGYGILHGGAIEVAYRSLKFLDSVDEVPGLIELVKKGVLRLFGYGHRVYKVVDPRLAIINRLIDSLKGSAGDDEMLRIALEIDRIASTDEYFTSRKLCTNPDLFLSFIFKMIGIPGESLVQIAILPRAAGAMAHWRETLESKLVMWRPQQIFTGAKPDFVNSTTVEN